jgi:succinate dehydrogenase / fumarate reductase flavoprotein subunit
MNRQIGRGKIKCTTVTKCLTVIVDGKARGIIARNLAGEIERHSAHAVVASGGYGNVFSCQLMQWEVTLRQLGKYTRKGFLASCYTQIHPTCIPVSGDQSN